MLTEYETKMSVEQVSAYYDLGHMINQQNNRNHQMKMCLERRVSMNMAYTSIMNQRNAPSYAPTPTAPSPTPASSSMYWNEEAMTQQQQQTQHRRLDRSQSEPCSRTMPNVNSSRYKTELCRPFEEKGYCKYSDKCQFAHGECELKTIMRHPKYKTDLCHKYHTDGFCGYGTRCNFIHNENELQLTRIASNNQQAFAIQQQQQQHQQPHPQLVDPGPIQRPSSIMFGSSTSTRPESSLSDSSPLSAADSPSLSPTFLDSDVVFANALQPPPNPASYHHQPRFNNNSPPVNTTAISDNVSELAKIRNLLAPLYVHTHINLTNALSTNISHLHTQLNNQRNNDQLLDMGELASELSDIVAPHSPPDSISGDSLSSSGSSGSFDFAAVQCHSPDHSNKGLRLPVFTQFGPQHSITTADF